MTHWSMHSFSTIEKKTGPLFILLDASATFVTIFLLMDTIRHKQNHVYVRSSEVQYSFFCTKKKAVTSSVPAEHELFQPHCKDYMINITFVAFKS